VVGTLVGGLLFLCNFLLACKSSSCVRIVTNLKLQKLFNRCILFVRIHKIVGTSEVEI
jgi:hypothetical protein